MGVSTWCPGDGGGSASCSVPGAAVPQGVQGCPPQGRVGWAPVGSEDRAAPGLPGAPEPKSQALKQTIVKPCWFAEPVPTLQPPNQGSATGALWGEAGAHLLLGQGACGLCRQEEEETQEGEGSHIRFAGNRSSRGQRADVGAAPGVC